MTLEERVFERGGCRLHAWVGGASGGSPVVFTHGATIDHRKWQATLPLVAERYRVVAWDVRGHGASRPGRFNVAEAVGDLVALLDLFGFPQATFVGHSMGGNLHQELVFRHPDRVRALACVDCTWNFQRLTALEKLTLKMAPILRLTPERWLLEQSLKATSNSKTTRDLLRPMMNQHSKDEFIGTLLEASACLHYEPAYRVAKPLLLIVGDKDPTGNIRKAMPAWAAHEPHARLVVVPDVRHAPNLDAPDLFHRELLAFLAALPTLPGPT